MSSQTLVSSVAEDSGGNAGPQVPGSTNASSPQSQDDQSNTALPDGEPSSSPEPPDLKLDLHSPSELLGTPFSISTRFEYPFPETPPSSTDAPYSSFAGPPPLPLSPLSASSPSLQQHPFFNPHLPLDKSAYSSTHPRMRIVASQDPPVPPALEKKRQRWSLSLTDGAAAASDRLDHTSEGSRDGASGNGKSHLSNGSILPLDHCWQDPVDADTCAGRDNGLPVEIAADTVMGDSQ